MTSLEFLSLIFFIHCLNTAVKVLLQCTIVQPIRACNVSSILCMYTYHPVYSTRSFYWLARVEQHLAEFMMNNFVYSLWLRTDIMVTIWNCYFLDLFDHTRISRIPISLLWHFVVRHTLVFISFFFRFLRSTTGSLWFLGSSHGYWCFHLLTVSSLLMLNEHFEPMWTYVCTYVSCLHHLCFVSAPPEHSCCLKFKLHAPLSTI